ncbi:hypothetical protein [Achromobacter sp. RTa]|uniref:hypothetical protein n=1 Tax=Achromobacter sp. RTa TaxID=1532557 RepID=UPI0012E03A32|nr:hypothetical protein [Achromobacter sp. RTa]
MVTPRALVSSITSSIDEDFRVNHLKLCFLWYEEILIETLGKFDERRFYAKLLGKESDNRKISHTLSDIIVPLEKRVQKDVIGDVLSRSGPGYPRWGDEYENYTYPEPENGEQFAHNQLLQHIANERGFERFEDGYDIEQAEGRARAAVDAVLLWERVNNELPCMLQTNGDEKLAMVSAQQFSAGENGSPNPFILFDTEIPCLESVSWEQIIQFRKNGSLKSLRDKFGDSFRMAGGNLDQAKVLFDQTEQDALTRLLTAQGRGQ